MTRRNAIASAFVVAALALFGFASTTPAYAQSSPPPGASMPSSDAERALAAQHPREWANLTPDQRQRVLENYQRWQSMRPEDRQRVQKPIRWSEPPDFPQDLGIRCQVAVAQHGALGAAGRSRRVEKGGEIVARAIEPAKFRTSAGSDTNGEKLSVARSFQ